MWLPISEQDRVKGWEENGRIEETRTPDPHVPNVVRYQLRYYPNGLRNRFCNLTPFDVCTAKLQSFLWNTQFWRRINAVSVAFAQIDALFYIYFAWFFLLNSLYYQWLFVSLHRQSSPSLLTMLKSCEAFFVYTHLNMASLIPFTKRFESSENLVNLLE